MCLLTNRVLLVDWSSLMPCIAFRLPSCICIAIAENFTMWLTCVHDIDDEQFESVSLGILIQLLFVVVVYHCDVDCRVFVVQ